MWTSSTLVLAGAFLAALRFGHAFARLRRRGRADCAGWSRAALFASGLVLATAPLVSPLVGAAGSSLPAHMLEHVLVADAAPALLLVAVRGPLLAFVIPAAAIRAVTRTSALKALTGLAARPWVVLAAWATAYAAWHVPAAFELALASPAVHHLEHASFVLVGVASWALVVDPARRGRLSVECRLLLVGALFALGQALTLALLLAPAPLYPSYDDGAGSLTGQQTAALVMMTEQMLTLGACAVLLVRSLVPGRRAGAETALRARPQSWTAARRARPSSAS